MIQAVIIDDSRQATELLQNMLDRCTDPPVEVCGTANDVAGGTRLIRETSPNLVFLDIELGNQTGFDLLNQLEDPDFNLIFTTGHNEYALEAFRFNALHYLLKPIGQEDLQEALKRIQKNEEKALQRTAQEVKSLMNDYMGARSKKLSLGTEEGVRFINTADIVYIKADGSYTNVKMADGASYLLSRLLKEFEEQLNNALFYRLSKSYLINMNQVVMYRRIDGGTVEMSDGTLIPVPRRKRDEFLLRMAEFME